MIKKSIIVTSVFIKHFSTSKQRPTDNVSKYISIHAVYLIKNIFRTTMVSELHVLPGKSTQRDAVNPVLLP